MKKKLLTILISVLLIVVAMPQVIFADVEQENLQNLDITDNLIEDVVTDELDEDTNEIQDDAIEKHRHTCEVTFYGNFEDSDYVETIEETYESNYKLPEQNPTRLGYRFDGWYTQKEEGYKITGDSIVKGTIDSLYAHWKKDKHSVAARQSFYAISEDESRIVYYHYDNLLNALKDAEAFNTIYLLKDLEIKSDIVINDLTYLDLNHHNLETSGKIENNGSVYLYEQNYPLIKKIIEEKIVGTYYTSDNLSIEYKGSKYVVPKDTFFTYATEINPYTSDLSFALEDYLGWYGDVHSGTKLKAIYELILGGNIIAPDKKEKSKVADTKVTTTNLKLAEDIRIGSNNLKDGVATLFVETMDEDNVATIIADGKKIILNRTGVLTLSADAKYDEGIIVAGDTKLFIEKAETYYLDEDKLVKAYTYRLVDKHKFTNEEHTIAYNYDDDLEFVTDGEYVYDEDVVVKVDDVEIDSSNYDLAHGSIHVALHNDYLKTLKSGTHTITIVAKGYQTISQKFVIKSKPSPEPSHIIPKTGIE
ncbi:MAG: InlB B-repeat-containing protein [Erysipelotrichaceae bacterium]|nr:InlB B-repeat-containing protein [Erysipelotrichaceae bacterium]